MPKSRPYRWSRRGYFRYPGLPGNVTFQPRHHTFEATDSHIKVAHPHVMHASSEGLPAHGLLLLWRRDDQWPSEEHGNDHG